MPRLPILVYHKVDEIPDGARYPRNYVRPAQFEEQLAWLKARGYQSVSFCDYLAYRAGTARLPRRPVLVTFDDGYRTNRDVALPILERFGYTATIFIVTGLIGSTNRWDPSEIQEPLLTADEIRDMVPRGISFESHTHTHPHLPELSEQQALRELCESRAALKELTGREARVICYPFADHDARIENLARTAGYEAGVTIRRRLNDDESNLLTLRRIPVTYERSLASFAWDLVRLRWNSD